MVNNRGSTTFSPSAIEFLKHTSMGIHLNLIYIKCESSDIDIQVWFIMVGFYTPV